MGVLGEGPEAELVDPEAVPSLSVRQRFVLPLVRADVKRVLEPAPYPPVVEPMLAIPGLPVPPPAPVELAGPPPVVQPAQKSYPAPRIAPRPSGTVPAAPLATAMVMTPIVPRPEPLRFGKGARLAILIDDMGPPRSLTQRAIRLPVPITMSFLPYADDLAGLTAAARAQGHEIFLHLPMEPVGTEDPGPNAILVGLEPNEFSRRLAWAFDRVPGATGVNNHMGSRATSDP